MQIRSLAYRTDFFLLQQEGMVEEQEGYLLLRTPSNPSHFWGNLLFFPTPPHAGDYERWMSLYTNHFSSDSQIRHRTFGWDSPEGETGELEPFLSDGFSLEEGLLLSAKEVCRPGRYNKEVHVRPVTEEAEWEEVLRQQMLCRPSQFNEERYHRVKQGQMLSFQRLIRQGTGVWFGAFLEGRLVGNLGLFALEKYGRFQGVGTHPDFRRRGVCSTLLYEASSFAFSQMKLETLLLLADPEYHAQKIYAAAGFEEKERQVGVCRWDAPPPPPTIP